MPKGCSGVILRFNVFRVVGLGWLYCLRIFEVKTDIVGWSSSSMLRLDAILDALKEATIP